MRHADSRAEVYGTREGLACHSQFSGGWKLTMWTYIVHRADGPFVRTELARPAPIGGQVLIRIQASGINPLDAKIRSGKADHARHPLPAVLGLDMAGTVVEVGEGVTAFHPGDEVYGMVGGVGGLQGTLAEFIVADADLLAHKPRNLPMRQAAALPLVTITAWEGLVDRAGVGRGQKVLIHGGAGGVGHVAVQIAKSFEAEVFATGSVEQRGMIERFGATAIDYKSRKVEDYVEEATAGRGFDIVYDTVGGATLDASFLAVKRYSGHVVSCLGWGTHSLAPLSFRSASYSGVFTLLPLLTGDGRRRLGRILADAAALVEAGKLRPVLNERIFTSNELEEAYRSVTAGSSGKIVVSDLE
ncbi:MAG TPA: zinc-dependent alcohol dehydrogenase family protein [Bryobacteraceae bacterium]|nr:zinc-dependent alcohol dehydrogenase family protein [Bryobacteraceae bacterium]